MILSGFPLYCYSVGKPLEDLHVAPLLLQDQAQEETGGRLQSCVCCAARDLHQQTHLHLRVDCGCVRRAGVCRRLQRHLYNTVLLAVRAEPRPPRGNRSDLTIDYMYTTHLELTHNDVRIVMCVQVFSAIILIASLPGFTASSPENEAINLS